MPATPSTDDREELEQLTAAWEEHNRTFDVSAVADFPYGENADVAAWCVSY